MTPERKAELFAALNPIEGMLLADERHLSGTAKIYLLSA